jgi:hypothetical protein
MSVRQPAYLATLSLLALATTLAAQQPLVPLPRTQPELISDPTNSMNNPGRPTRLPDDVSSTGSAAQVVFSLDYKLWRPRRQANDFAIADPNVDGVVEGPIQSLNPGFDSGFRIAADYRRTRSNWDVEFAYTYFRAYDSLAVNAPAGGLLWATQTRPGIIEVADTATATSRFQHDVFDLAVGHTFQFDPNFIVRLQGGARIGHIAQDFSAFYNGGNAVDTQVASGFDFVGAGFMLGGEAHWAIWRGFSLFGQSRIGMLLGATDSYLRETDSNGVIINSSVTERASVAVPVLEMAIGLEWTRGKWTFGAGYEVGNWFQIISTPDFADDVTRGRLIRRQSNYSVDGLFFRVAYTY